MNSKWLLDASNPKYRTIRAIQKIANHELIFETEAIALTAYVPQRANFCSFCFQESSALSKCASCSLFYYCGPECQKKDWLAYHKIECEGLKKAANIEYSNELILSLRLYLVYKENAGFQDSILKMKSHEDIYSEAEMAEIKEMSKKISEILNEDPKEIPTIFSIICKAKINFFTIEKPSYVMNMSVGTGFYQGEANYFNHSCLPNALKIYSNRKLKIFASEEILPEQEIFICYDDIMGKPFNWRQAYLKKHYKMTCLCRLCSKEAKNDKEIYPNIGLKCGKCPEKGEIINNKCKSCGFIYKYADLATLHHDLESTFEKTLKNMKKFEESLIFLEEIKKARLEVHSFLIEMIVSSIIHQYFNLCFETHPKECYNLLKFYVRNYQKWFEIKIPSFGFKINELSKLALKMKKGKKARRYCEEAWQHLSLHFSEDNCKEMKELANRRVLIQGLLDTGSEIRKNENKGILKID